MNYPLCCDKSLIDNLSSDDLDKQSEAASQLNNYIFAHEDLAGFLVTDCPNLKTFALLKIKKIESQKDADLLMSCLTNNESSVREACSFKIKELILNNDYREFFQKDDYIDTFVAAITDINPKVCKNISTSLLFIKNKQTISQKIIEIIKQALEDVQGYKRIQGHKYNKITFRLYWCLEALNEIICSLDTKNNSDVFEILEKGSKNREYTIREKIAFLIKNIEKLELPDSKKEAITLLKEKLSEDDNFYVRLVINN